MEVLEFSVGKIEPLAPSDIYARVKIQKLLRL